MKCKVCGKECLSTARNRAGRLINCCLPCMREKEYDISCIWTKLEPYKRTREESKNA